MNIDYLIKYISQYSNTLTIKQISVEHNIDIHTARLIYIAAKLLNQYRISDDILPDTQRY